jgi:hypothetical protein
MLSKLAQHNQRAQCDPLVICIVLSYYFNSMSGAIPLSLRAIVDPNV